MQVWNIILIFLTFFFLTYCAHNPEIFSEKESVQPAQMEPVDEPIKDGGLEAAKLEEKMYETIQKLDVTDYHSIPKPTSSANTKLAAIAVPIQERVEVVARLQEPIEAALEVDDPELIVDEEEPTEAIEANVGSNSFRSVVLMILGALFIGILSLFFYIKRKQNERI